MLFKPNKINNIKTRIRPKENPRQARGVWIREVREVGKNNSKWMYRDTPVGYLGAPDRQISVPSNGRSSSRQALIRARQRCPSGQPKAALALGKWDQTMGIQGRGGNRAKLCLAQPFQGLEKHEEILDE
jgi:hypothetical protein